MTHLVVHASSIDLVYWWPFGHIRLWPVPCIKAVAAVINQFVRLDLSKSQLFGNAIKIVESPLLFQV